MMNRKEFSELLREWKQSFIVEKTIPQPQNISSLGASGESGIVKKSRQLDAWLTYLTVWRPNSPEQLNKYSEDSDTYDEMWDAGRQRELDYNAIELDNPDSKFSMEFEPMAKKLGFKVSAAKSVMGSDHVTVRVSPKQGKGEELKKLFSFFAGDEARKIEESGCCNDNLPLFIVPFDFDPTLRIPGLDKHSSSSYKVIDEKLEKEIMHWAIHDMWHLVPEFFSLGKTSKIMGMEGNKGFVDFEEDRHNQDFGSTVSFASATGFEDNNQRKMMNLTPEDDMEFIADELSEFINKKGYVGDTTVGDIDIGPSIFSYVLMNVESHEDIDREMANLSDGARRFVKAVFDLAPDYWNKICSFFENEVIVFVR